MQNKLHCKKEIPYHPYYSLVKVGINSGVKCINTLRKTGHNLENPWIIHSQFNFQNHFLIFLYYHILSPPFSYVWHCLYLNGLFGMLICPMSAVVSCLKETNENLQNHDSSTLFSSYSLKLFLYNHIWYFQLIFLWSCKLRGIQT